MGADGTDHQDRRWTFLTNHARVLLAIARDPEARLRTIAAACLITERAVQAIVADLEQAGFLHCQRVGRRNQYTLSLDQPLRHPAQAGLTIRTLVDMVDREKENAAQPSKTASASVSVSKTQT